MPGLGGRLDRRVRLVEPEVVELADRRVAGRDASRGRPRRTRRGSARRSATRPSASIAVAPRPEVAALGRGPRSARWNAWQCAFDEARAGESVSATPVSCQHGRRASRLRWRSSRMR